MRWVILIPVTVLVFGLSSAITAQVPPLPVDPKISKEALDNQATLKDLGPIDISFEGSNTTLDKLGLTKEYVRSFIAKKLKAAGIAIDEKALPTFLINVHILDIGDQKLAFKIRAEMYQVVTLERRKNVATLAATWMIDGLGTEKLSDPHEIASAIVGCIDKFVLQYKAENSELLRKP
jgi:hypothetical protein